MHMHTRLELKRTCAARPRSAPEPVGVAPLVEVVDLLVQHGGALLVDALEVPAGVERGVSVG